METFISFGGFPCKKCRNEHPEWECTMTNKPREGDYEQKCVHCGDVSPVYGNKETIRLLRVEAAKTSETMTKWCHCCHTQRTMIIENGPTIIKGWRIAECVECGKRYDLF